MIYFKLFKEHIHIILLYFVLPCHQLANESSKSAPKNGLANNYNEVVNNRNINKISVPTHTQKQSAKIIPITIVPQPLLTGRKVVLRPSLPVLHNHDDSKKIQRIVANNKMHIEGKELSPKQDPVPTKHSETKLVIKPKEPLKFYEDEGFDDIKVKPDKHTEKKKQPIVANHKKNVTDETFVKADIIVPKMLEPNIKDKRTDNKTIVLSKELAPQVQMYKNKSHEEPKHTLKQLPVKKNVTMGKISDNVQQTDFNKPSIFKNITKTEKKIPEENVSSSSVQNEEDNNIKPEESFDRTISTENLNNRLHEDNIPTITKFEINVDPTLMKKITDDASDKIMIKNYKYEELQERYTPDILVKDKTFIKEDHEYENDRNKVSKIPNTPTDRIWRAWRNTEIHIKSSDDMNNKSTETVDELENKPNEEFKQTKRELCDCYSNANFQPMGYNTNYFDSVKFDTTFKIEPHKIDSYNTMAQNPVRYYLPTCYYESFPTCYQPRSYGNQFAPLSRYQNYVFPCI